MLHNSQDEPLLVMMMGLPRSGKSTQARALSEQLNAPIVNPDCVRMALHGHAFIPSAEDFVWAIVRNMVSALFMADHRVVILDATNTTRKRRDEWKRHRRALILVDTPMLTCLDRLADQDSDDEHKESLSRVIKAMTDNWQLPSPDEGFAGVFRSAKDLYGWVVEVRKELQHVPRGT